MAEDLQLEFTVSDKIKAIQTSNSKILKILSQKHCVILCEEFIGDRFSHTGTCSVKTALEPQPGYECPGTKVCSKPCTLHRCHSFIPVALLLLSICMVLFPLLLPSPQCAQGRPTECTAFIQQSYIFHSPKRPWPQSGEGREQKYLPDI